jgi:hypothetical protein
MSAAQRLTGAALLAFCATGLSGCIVGTVVGTAVDVGVEVVKVPFKVGKGVYDVLKDDDATAKSKTADAGSAGTKKD